MRKRERMLISNGQVWAEPQNAERIDLTEEADLHYWTKKLSCTSHDLIHAIQAVGISVADLTSHLKRRSALATSR
jgi:hypothetical protein